MGQKLLKGSVKRWLWNIIKATRHFSWASLDPAWWNNYLDESNSVSTNYPGSKIAWLWKSAPWSQGYKRGARECSTWYSVWVFTLLRHWAWNFIYNASFKAHGNSKLPPFPHSIDEENVVWVRLKPKLTPLLMELKSERVLSHYILIFFFKALFIWDSVCSPG